jgi:hypothetical protein
MARSNADNPPRCQGDVKCASGCMNTAPHVITWFPDKGRRPTDLPPFCEVSSYSADKAPGWLPGRFPHHASVRRAADTTSSIPHHVGQ